MCLLWVELYSPKDNIHVLTPKTWESGPIWKQGPGSLRSPWTGVGPNSNWLVSLHEEMHREGHMRWTESSSATSLGALGAPGSGRGVPLDPPGEVAPPTPLMSEFLELGEKTFLSLKLRLVELGRGSRGETKSVL